MIVASRPAPALRPLIRSYYQVGTRLVRRTQVQPVPARTPQAIEFTFGTPFEVHRLDRGTVETAHRVALIGAQTFRRVDLVMQGTVDAFTVVFQPGGLLALFRLPGEVLTDDHFDGEGALGERLRALARRLGDALSFEDRVRVANDCFMEYWPPSGPVSVVSRAAAEVLRRGGRVGVSDLARATGMGIRQFERRFRYEVGIPPKRYTRIARFEAALRCKAASPGTTWADVAHAMGYHDQMHMVHDFHRLSGDSPTAIVGRLDMFVRPELVSAGDSHDR